MNINEMSLDQATDAAVRVSAAISFICEDEEVLELFKEIGDMEDITFTVGVTQLLPKITRLALLKHRDSLYEIIGALSQKDKKNVGKMNFKEAVDLLRENWETIIGFFPSSGSSTLRIVQDTV